MRASNRPKLIALLVAIYLAAGCSPILGKPGTLSNASRPTPTRTTYSQTATVAAVLPTLKPTPTLAPTYTPTPVQPLETRVVEIPAPSLEGNLLGDPTTQPLRVLLPPSYDSGTRRYPVVYLLPGFGGDAVVDEYFQPGPIAEEIAQGKVKEMILVAVNGENRLGGSMYTNSPVIGNWEDFVTQDVVRYIDEHFRTIPEPAGRGITGHSMGGFGALNLAMRHPDLFGSVYAMSPGLFDQNGLADSHMFTPKNKIKAFLKALTEVKSLPDQEAIKKMEKADGPVGFTFAYGAAFAPNVKLGPPYFDYPYTIVNDEQVRDPVIWQRWDEGFGKLDEKVKQYKANLRKLNGITIDYGRQDGFEWIPRGSEYLAQQLDAANIPNTLLSYEGTHSDRVQERILGYVLPFFSQKLADPQPIEN